MVQKLKSGTLSRSITDYLLENGAVGAGISTRARCLWMKPRCELTCVEAEEWSGRFAGCRSPRRPIAGGLPEYMFLQTTPIIVSMPIHIVNVAIQVSRLEKGGKLVRRSFGGR